jgi:hypothetical protein
LSSNTLVRRLKRFSTSVKAIIVLRKVQREAFDYIQKEAVRGEVYLSDKFLIGRQLLNKAIFLDFGS